MHTYGVHKELVPGGRAVGRCQTEPPRREARKMPEPPGREARKMDLLTRACGFVRGLTRSRLRPRSWRTDGRSGGANPSLPGWRRGTQIRNNIPKERIKPTKKTRLEKGQCPKTMSVKCRSRGVRQKSGTHVSYVRSCKIDRIMCTSSNRVINHAHKC